MEEDDRRFEMEKMKKQDYVIGVIGGMGSYATADFFKRLIDSFPAEKEWERPRILIDNRCTMPSRVRAILYQEGVRELVDSLCESTEQMMNAGAARIVLVCNTSHYFLKDIVDRLPQSKDLFINIIEECAKCCDAGKRIELIASEGTIDSGIYRDVMKGYQISLIEPDDRKYPLIRSFIEAVKQNDMNENAMESFRDYLERSEADQVILGCTELPILYAECQKQGISISKTIIDPLQCAIDILVEEYNAL